MKLSEAPSSRIIRTDGELSAGVWLTRAGGTRGTAMSPTPRVPRGTITDAIYLRPHARTTLLTVGAGRLEAGAALIASWAVEPTSTPSGERALGIEPDPELRYTSRDGFAGALTYGLYLPGAAFDSTTPEAKPAHAVRARLWFVF